MAEARIQVYVRRGSRPEIRLPESVFDVIEVEDPHAEIDAVAKGQSKRRRRRPWHPPPIVVGFRDFIRALPEQDLKKNQSVVLTADAADMEDLRKLESVVHQRDDIAIDVGVMP